MFLKLWCGAYQNVANKLIYVNLSFQSWVDNLVFKVFCFDKFSSLNTFFPKAYELGISFQFFGYLSNHLQIIIKPN
jgi:hypothetical protein